MKRVLLICLSLFLALVGWSAACADDGYWRKGVASPSPRFTDNGNGTVTDNLTRLIWMKDAGVLGTKNWDEALTTANTLASGSGGLTDGSQAGDWRLPNIRELQSLVDYGRYNPALPAVNPFTNVQSGSYWSSSSFAQAPTPCAWLVDFYDGYVSTDDKIHTTPYYVWCVRGGP